MHESPTSSCTLTAVWCTLYKQLFLNIDIHVDHFTAPFMVTALSSIFECRFTIILRGIFFWSSERAHVFKTLTFLQYIPTLFNSTFLKCVTGYNASAQLFNPCIEEWTRDTRIRSPWRMTFIWIFQNRVLKSPQCLHYKDHPVILLCSLFAEL
jgi:hypothetical protein